MLIMAVDVGVTGCITLLDINTLEASFHVLPAIQYGTSTGSKRRRLDENQLVTLISSLAGPQVVFAIVEHQQAFYKGGSSSTFTLGDCYGLVRASILSHRFIMELVKPRVWKEAFNLIDKEECTQSQRKERSRQLALKLFPAAAPMLKRKKDHDRAESLLIAEYARRYILPRYIRGYDYRNTRPQDSLFSTPSQDGQT